MSQFSPSLWDTLHANGRMPEDTWPTDDVIRQVARLGYLKQDRSSITCLDIGCGSGPMTWYLAKSGYSVSAIDGSETAVETSASRLQREGVSASITSGDVCNLPYSDDSFNFCVESQCLMCMSMPVAHKAIQEIYRVTQKGGYFISRTPSTDCWGCGIGTPAGLNEYRDAQDGPFVGMGLARFLSRNDIDNVYAPFSPVCIEQSQMSISNMAHIISMWVIVCRKGE